MSFKVAWNNSVVRAVQTWSLPDEVFVEMRLRVNALKNFPAERLERITYPFSGMAFRVQIIDPGNRLCVHTFLFSVLYSQDEESLFIAHGTYNRRFG